MNNSNVPGSITDSVQDRDNFPLQSKSDAFELLRANYYALHDLTEISRYLSTAEHYIQDYEETIDKSEDEVLVSLRNRQKELHGQITWYRSLFAPIRRLPLEVLSRIFALVCVECKFSHKEIDCPSTRLSHVCAGWRELARSIPILWSHININFSWESSIRCGPDTIRSILTTHLELSQNLPLSVALIRVPASLESQITEIINLLASHSRRWQDLDFEGDVWPDGIFASIKGNLPQLRSLSLDIWEEEEEFVNQNGSPSSRDVDIFHDAPLLRVVRYNRLSDHTVKFPWTQITDFTIQYSWCSEALEDLSRVTMADKVTFYCCGTRQRALTTLVTPATMPFRSLSIYVHSYDGFRLSQWFRRLTLPNLNILQLFGFERHDYLLDNRRLTIEDLPSFISRSSCTIRTLSFSKLAVSDKDVIAVLRSLPMLSKLTIHERHYGDYGKNMAVTGDFLKHLTVDHGKLKRDVDESFLSRLEALELRIHAPFATEKLVHMIQSRWIPEKHSDRLGVVSLLSFNLMVLYEREVIDIPTAGLQMLDTLKADGLEYKLTVEALRDDELDYSDDSECSD